MLNKVAWLGLLVTCLGVEARAQSAPLTSEEMRAELFGIHMYGIETAANFRWDECIEPSGRTVFRVEVPDGIAPYSQNGQLRIEEGGVACFSYPPDSDPDPACFRALRRGDGYAFFSTQGASGVFLTTRVERGKDSCPNPGEMIG